MSDKVGTRSTTTSIGGELCEKCYEKLCAWILCFQVLRENWLQSAHKFQIA